MRSTTLHCKFNLFISFDIMHNCVCLIMTMMMMLTSVTVQRYRRRRRRRVDVRAQAVASMPASNIRSSF